MTKTSNSQLLTEAFKRFYDALGNVIVTGDMKVMMHIQDAKTSIGLAIEELEKGE